jgi:hypothetical protein
VAGAAPSAARPVDPHLDPAALDDVDRRLLRHLLTYGPTRQQNLAAIYARQLDEPGAEVVARLHRLNDRAAKGRWVQHGVRRSKTTGTPYRTWWLRQAARGEITRLFPDIGR